MQKFVPLQICVTMSEFVQSFLFQIVVAGCSVMRVAKGFAEPYEKIQDDDKTFFSLREELQIL